LLVGSTVICIIIVAFVRRKKIGIEWIMGPLEIMKKLEFGEDIHGGFGQDTLAEGLT
jgi:hypothetical protein